MRFFRAYIAPLLIVLTFLIAMVAVSARIFLPSDMVAPAPVEEPTALLSPDTSGITGDDRLPDISRLIHGQPDQLG